VVNSILGNLFGASKTGGITSGATPASQTSSIYPPYPPAAPGYNKVTTMQQQLHPQIYQNIRTAHAGTNTKGVFGSTWDARHVLTLRALQIHPAFEDSAVRALLHMAESDDPSARMHAVWDQRTPEARIIMMQGDSNPEVRAAVVERMAYDTAQRAKLAEEAEDDGAGYGG